MILTKYFFGYPLNSITDYVIVYAISAAIIIVGIILLKQLKKKQQPATPQNILSECEQAEALLKKIIWESESDGKKFRAIAKEVVKLQIMLNSLVYSCTLIIDDLKDISFETVRSSLTNAINNLDLAKNEPDASKMTEIFKSASDEIEKAKKTLSEIGFRYKYKN